MPKLGWRAFGVWGELGVVAGKIVDFEAAVLTLVVGGWQRGVDLQEKSRGIRDLRVWD